jgi:hypothetical protein
MVVRFPAGSSGGQNVNIRSVIPRGTYSNQSILKAIKAKGYYDLFGLP